jgi:hypothetical protein
MAASKRGGHASIITANEGQHGKGTSSKPSRSGVSNRLTVGEVTKAVNYNLELSTKQKKGSSNTSSTGNRARIVKGGI